MALRVYNSLTRTKEIFEPVEPGVVRMYLCGPTVYKETHIGHLVGPLIFDAIKRFLLFSGYRVEWIVNITDVDDKLIDKANQTGRSVEDIARQYEAEYHKTLADLGIDTIDRFPRASEHMPEIIALCQRLIDAGRAYAAEGNVWFDVSKDEDYGKLSGRRPDEQEAGGRELAGTGKKSPADFALWKAAKPGEPAWDSPWGPGRPGWHIECSAMSMKYLGDTFDIHGGGLDLVFPHHENELAQSESATGKPFAKYWLHNGLTRMRTKLRGDQVKNEKMSGSLGNVVSAKALIAEHGGDLLRYMILATHYRSPIDFSEGTIEAAGKGLGTFTRLFERLSRLGVPESTVEASPADAELKDAVEHLEGRFMAAMSDDFNTAGAVGVLHELAGEVNGFIERTGLEKQPDAARLRDAAAAGGLVKRLGLLLGLFRVAAPPAVQDGLTDDLMQLLIDLRAAARKSKNFETADTIRDRLAALNVQLEDTPQGTVWRRG
ncbi:MAG: cysteine--tRNA ligase [Phycisphaerae bacterium]